MKTVFTCGVFDLLHWGHVHFLIQARSLGDRLIVGVNDDRYVAASKGRPPVFPLRERLQMLRALECVDDVKVFSEPDPCALIRRLKPQIVAKGQEYRFGNAPEKALIEELGGQFVLLDSLPIHTSEIRSRVLANAATTC